MIPDINGLFNFRRFYLQSNIMKRNIVITLSAGLLLLFVLAKAQDVKPESKQKANLIHNTNQNAASDSTAMQAVKTVKPDQLSEEKRKKEIEAKEHSVNKKKKVKTFGVDETLPQLIRERNIP